MREWRYGCGPDEGGGSSTAVLEAAEDTRGQAEIPRRVPVVEFLCIHLYWKVSKQKYDWLFVESDRN